MKIAIIGAGISGHAAALALQGHHDITLYEKRDRPGGHSATVDVEYDGCKIAVDTGFIVYNERNYPSLCAMFDHLGVKTELSCMSFSVSLDNARLECCGSSLAEVFAQPLNIINPKFLRMLKDILRFNRQAITDLDNHLDDDMPLGQYLQWRGFSRSFIDWYLVPMAAAIWSTPPGGVLNFPAATLMKFFRNHQLLQIQTPLWRTVSGGSRNYVTRLHERLGEAVRLSTEIASVRRDDRGLIVTDVIGHSDRFDHVILACHSDQALRLLADADADQRDVLSAIPYRPNEVWLHRDPDLMPKRRKAWAAWNFIGGSGSQISVTYWMNRLQNIDEAYPLFVSLNPVKPPRDDVVFRRFQYDHPQYDAAAIDAQERLPAIQGRGGLWFCGAWTAHGFHEDGMASGLRVAEALGGFAPWQPAAARGFLEAAE